MSIQIYYVVCSKTNSVSQDKWQSHSNFSLNICINMINDTPSYFVQSWWRHQMETFSASMALCAGNSPVNSEFPTQRPVTRSFDVFYDLCLNKRLTKQSRGWWFETPSRSLLRHCNVCPFVHIPALWLIFHCLLKFGQVWWLNGLPVYEF